MSLYEDLFLQISQYLSNKENIALSMTSKLMNGLKYKIIYSGKVQLVKIINLSYFDNFENVDIMNMTSYERLPQKIKHIHFNNKIKKNIPLSVTHWTFEGYYFYPLEAAEQSVTHLIFGDRFDNVLHKNRIPPLVTHIIFGWSFDRPIKDSIPPSVTHLTFGYCFNQSIEGCIPTSVTHLTFGDRFNKTIKDCLPSSITHLTFGNAFDQVIKNRIPQSVTHLIFGNKFDQPIKDCIPPSVTHLTLCPYDQRKRWAASWYFHRDIPPTVKNLTLLAAD